MSGRGKSQKTLALVSTMHDILVEIQPASVRSVCYQLFTKGWIDSMAKKNTSKVSKQLVWAREQGIIPWPWVVDEHRRPEQIASWDDPESLIEAAVSQYRKDYWTDQPYWIEVWSEKGTVRGTLDPILTEYGLPFRVMHGYSSATTIYDVATQTQIIDKPLIVLYVGDWDPSGLNMSEKDIPERFDRYHSEATIKRMALTEYDVVHRSLPSFEAASKAKDTRHKWFVEHYGHQCWELDALPPNLLRKAVEEAIYDHLAPAAWEHAKRIEQAEVESIQDLVGEWKSSISRHVSKYSDSP